MEPNSTSLMAHLVITQVRLQTVVRVSKRYNILVSRAQGLFKGVCRQGFASTFIAMFSGYVCRWYRVVPHGASSTSFVSDVWMEKYHTFFVLLGIAETPITLVFYTSESMKGWQFRVDYGTMVLQASTSVVFMVIHVSSILILSNTRTHAMLRKKSFYRPVMHS
jgi:hypothetical protein